MNELNFAQDLMKDAQHHEYKVDVDNAKNDNNNNNDNDNDTVVNDDKKEQPILTVCQFIPELDAIYSNNSHESWDEKRKEIHDLLCRVHLSTEEVNKYTFWDFSSERPYTRNLVHADGKNYTLLILCWNIGWESSIHNHPCEGCFIKTLRGCIRETRYEVHPETDEIRRSKVRFFNEGQVSFMHDNLGLHKIGNTCKNTGAVTLHLYTPPFKTCRVWSDSDSLSSGREAKPGYFSVFGHPSPLFLDKERSSVLKDLPAHAAAFHSKRTIA